MLQNIPSEITIASFSVIGILTGYVWNSQNKRICKMEIDQKNCTFPKIKIDIAEIKTDIKWILRNMKK